MTQTMRIICVCSGNICRSPMAEVLLKQRLEEAGLPAVVISAGTLGINGRRAAEFARAAVRDLGCDLDGHRSQGISLPLMRMADHILIMAPRHEHELLNRDPGLRQRIVRLWEFASDPCEAISDPVGKDLQTFIACRDLLVDCLENWLEHLRKPPPNRR